MGSCCVRLSSGRKHVGTHVGEHVDFVANPWVGMLCGWARSINEMPVFVLILCGLHGQSA